MSNNDTKEKLANEVTKDFVWRRRWRLLTWIGVSIFAVLRNVFNNENVKVVILDINSGGGSPSDAERIISEIDRLRKKHLKPIMSVIGSLGASAAYMIAVHTDKVVAGKYS